MNAVIVWVVFVAITVIVVTNIAVVCRGRCCRPPRPMCI
jgi:hypothetical protein